MSVLTQSNLLPFRQYNESEVVNLFALDGTGLNGLFVTLVTGTNDPANSAGSYGSVNVGASYANATSLRHLVTRTVKPSVATDMASQILGVTLHTVAEVDENGNKLINWPAAHAAERGYVVSGQAVPILKRGIITLKKSQITGTPIPGYLAVPAANGTVGVATPGDNVATASGMNIIGRWISTTGSAFGGYAQLDVQL